MQMRRVQAGFTLRWIALACLASVVLHHILLRSALTLPWADDWIFIGRASSIAEGWQVALQRLHTWSPRPLSELTVFTVLPAAQMLHWPPDRMVQPLLLVSHLQALAIMYWPLLLAPIRRLGYTRLVSTVAVVTLVWLFSFKVDLHNLLFWGAAAAAYVPAMAGWLSAGCLIVLRRQLASAGLAELIVLQLVLSALACEVALLPLLVLPLSFYGSRVSRRFVVAHLLSFGLLCGLIVPVFQRRALVAAAIEQVGQASSFSATQSLVQLYQTALQLGSWLDWRSWLVLVVAAAWIASSRRAQQWRLGCALLAVAVGDGLFFILQSGIGFDQIRYGLLVLLFLAPGGLLLIVAAIDALTPWRWRQWPPSLLEAAFSLSCLLLFLGSRQVVQWRGYGSMPLDFSPPQLLRHHGAGGPVVKLVSYQNPMPGRAISQSLPAGRWSQTRLRALIAKLQPGQRYPYKVLYGVLKAYRLESIEVVQPLR